MDTIDMHGYSDDLVKHLAEQAVTDPNQLMISMVKIVNQAILRHLYMHCNAILDASLAQFVSECYSCKDTSAASRPPPPPP